MSDIDWQQLWKFLDYSGDQFSTVQSDSLREQFHALTNNPVMQTLAPGGAVFTSIDDFRARVEAVQPSLITLPRGGDLNAKISGASGPVLLDFFADWCGPCRTQGKILHDLETAAAKSQTLIIKINVDEHPQLAKELRVSSLPTLMMIKNGRIVERQTGVANKSRLVAWMR